MKITFTKSIIVAFLVIGFPVLLFAQPANDKCSDVAPKGAVTITSSTTCSTTTGDLYKATSSLSTEAPAGSCGAATSTTTYDVWYKFTASSTSPAITVSGLGNKLTAASTYVEVLSGTCGNFVPVPGGCQSVSSRLALSNLVVGNTYYIRVYVTSAPTANPSGGWGFTICVQDPPANDDCAGAITLTPNASCSATTTTMEIATPSTGLPSGCESAGTHYDVWYKFIATGVAQNIAISSLGSNINNPELQLYGGRCGALTSLACGTTSLTGTGLTAGNTYYIRVSNVGSRPVSSGNFSICITTPVLAKTDYSKSYINVTKGATGGTVNPGDTLEMRFTLVISTKSVDSLAIFDTLFKAKGLKFVPGSLALRTNEGKVYKSFTDALDNDAGWITTSGQDTVIRINFGNGASNVARGQLSSTSKPSVFGNTCIIMVTYRVSVYAAYNTKINFKTGALTYRDAGAGIMNTLTFAPNNLIVYQSPGLCPNAVSPTNTLGAEYNGTFGVPLGSAPLARNRGTSPNTGYTYAPFTASGGPNDYYYGIANNTSQTFTTITTWPKPDASPSHRVFGVWDITGDHTGAANAVKGNPACDTTKPVSPTNPCGYMLVINSAYRTDTAFTHTITNLCPNTYYELSAWFKNICYKCGCDSNGVGASSTGYIATAPGDSSGVRPNIAFDVNGTDYYTTGDLMYLGTTQGGSDSTNQWVKKGFTYLTGPTETSFRLTLRNNAPGGGGNDWALDDISVATCSPNLSFTPSANTTACDENVVDISGTVKSYFNNYTYYKWEKSTDNGVSWIATTNTGTGTPASNGSGNYEYTVTYPQFVVNKADSGSQYRLLVATTSSNLNSSCALSGDTKLVLDVITCSPVLGVHFVSFTGKVENSTSLIRWTTSKENEDLLFIIEKSTNGYQFSTVGFVYGNKDHNNNFNTYSWSEASTPNQKVYYRVKMISKGSGEKYTKTVLLDPASIPQDIIQVPNPFSNKVSIELRTGTAGLVQVELINNNGMVIHKQSFPAVNGINLYTLSHTEGLPSGCYVLKVVTRNAVITKKLLKQ